MTIGRLLYILGIILIVYGLVSSFHFYFSMDESGSESNFSFSLNAGKIIVGAVLIYLGNRLKKDHP